MAIVIISSADEQTRRELAVNLARKLGCDSMSREQILDAATEAGIAVGRLEVAVLKRLAPRERLARDKARYLLCGIGMRTASKGLLLRNRYANGPARGPCLSWEELPPPASRDFSCDQDLRGA